VEGSTEVGGDLGDGLVVFKTSEPLELEGTIHAAIAEGAPSRGEDHGRGKKLVKV